ncbi:MAG: sugar ABC transporter permease [Actinomycetota bacterium]
MTSTTPRAAAPPPQPTTPDRPTSGPRPGSSLASRIRRRAEGYLYVAPFFLVFAVFGLYPLVYTGWVSLHDWDPLGDSTFIGLDNYERLLFDDPRFWNSVRNTLSIWVLSTVPQLIFALVLAQVLNERLLRGKTFFRMALLVPNITSVLAVAIVFTSIFGRDYGIVNWILESLGFERINWQAEKWSSHLAIATMVMWRWTGYNALIYLAGMQAIPRELYEAAMIDGASRWRQFVHVTVPQLRPTIIFTVIISTIGGMQIFAEPLVFGGDRGTEGGSGRQFQTMTLFLYEQGFRRFNFGYASAVAWLLVFLIAIFAVVNFFIVRRISTS